MAKVEARKDIFTKPMVVSCTDTLPLGNKWKDSEIPQAHLNFSQYMSRKEQTVAMGHNHFKWMHQKSSLEDERKA